MRDGGEHQRDGRLVGGRYRLVERIGSGGTGTVWRALDELTGREVAVREPKLPGDPADERHRRTAHRLHREARAAARVDHPCALVIHDVVAGEDGAGGPDVPDALPWIVMELVRGESLREVLRRGPVEVREAARIGRAVLGALRAAHAVGIVHRDVKPANVLLGPHGRVVLTDFGIAHAQDGQLPDGGAEFADSPEFVAPERMSGRIAGPAGDLWSLGALLYTAVEGRSPFRRTTPRATLAAVLAADPPDPQRAGPLGPLIVRLLAEDPERRPEAEEAAAVLEAVAEGRPAPDLPAKATPKTRGPDGPGESTKDTGTIRLPAPEPEPAPERDSGPGSESGPGPGRAPAPALTPLPRHRLLRHPAPVALLGLLLAGGAWLTTSSFLVETGSGSATERTATSTAAPDAVAAPGPGPGTWTVHREKDMDAVLAVPDGYAQSARRGGATRQPRLVTYAKDTIHLRLTQWDRAPRSPMSQAREAHRTGDGHPRDARTRYTRTSLQGYEAVLADTTYGPDGSPTRVMRLVVRTDDGRLYELRVDMPKGTPDEEKGRAVFEGARDRLEIGTD